MAPCRIVHHRRIEDIPHVIPQSSSPQRHKISQCRVAESITSASKNRIISYRKIRWFRDKISRTTIPQSSLSPRRNPPHRRPAKLITSTTQNLAPACRNAAKVACNKKFNSLLQSVAPPPAKRRYSVRQSDIAPSAKRRYSARQSDGSPCLIAASFRLHVRLLSETALVVYSPVFSLSICQCFRCLPVCASIVDLHVLLLSARCGFCRGLELTFAIYPPAYSTFIRNRIHCPSVCTSVVYPSALLLSARGDFYRKSELTFVIYPSAHSPFIRNCFPCLSVCAFVVGARRFLSQI